LINPREPRFERKSSGWQEKREGRTGSTVERFDEPAGDFRRNPSGRADFARPLRRRACPICRIALRAAPSGSGKIGSVAAAGVYQTGS
jgi:hypothetical protein